MIKGYFILDAARSGERGGIFLPLVYRAEDFGQIKSACFPIRITRGLNISIIPQKMLLVNTSGESDWNFSQINKKYLWTFDKMSIENPQKICYNEITKKEEVQTDENLKYKLS